MNNLPSYCGLVDAKIRASDKDLPVQRFAGFFPVRRFTNMAVINPPESKLEKRTSVQWS